MTTLNHANNAYAAQLAAQARTPKEFLSEPKIYFHHHNYAKFHVDLGGSRVKTIAFANYRYVTDDTREQNQLDLVADVPGTFIYTLANSEVARAMIQELAQEQSSEILRTAMAQAATNGQVFDPNSPIVPMSGAGVQIRPIAQTPNLAVQPTGGTAVVGIQSSVSGSAAVVGMSAQQTTPQTQTAPPTADTEAMARLAQLTADAQKAAGN